ncbi:MAG: hypothetical protein JXQ87_00190 [Bacteroidia bacterium]
MKQLLRYFTLALMLSFFGNLKADDLGKWPVDSSYNQLMLNTGYSAPAFHLGMHLGLELPIKRTYKPFNPMWILKYFGFERMPRKRKFYRQTTIEPFIQLFNHRFNHTNLGLGAAYHYRLISPYRLYASAGIEAGRAFQFYNDAIVFDERGNPSEQAILTTGYYQLGGLVEFGYEFSRKKHQAIYYRLHVGTLFPYNHVLNAYVRNEFGLRIIKLR